MNLRIFVVLAFSLAFAIGLTAQVAAATVLNTQNSTPITYPITYFIITGKVGYKIFTQNFAGQILPAKNVQVIAKNTATSEKKVATTSATGNYSIQVTSGTYSVSASDSKNTQFKPIEYILYITSSNITGVNFLGIIR